jgi:hypothetical protein
MATAAIRSESTSAGGQPATLWVLECPHGRFAFLTREDASPRTEGGVVRGELLPAHDAAHDPRCTERLWRYYMGLTATPEGAPDQSP